MFSLKYKVGFIMLLNIFQIFAGNRGLFWRYYNMFEADGYTDEFMAQSCTSVLHTLCG
jgi:hypothetical protein